MFQDYDVIKSIKTIENVPKGTMGAILMAYPSIPVHYEVEFIDGEGETIAVLTVSEEDIEFYQKE